MSEGLSRDQTFIRKLTEVVEANLTIEQFGVDELANEVGMSRSQIHRKLKSITNQSVSQFIRELRLEKAKVLLQQDSSTVSEIAYQVGFGSPTYFIKCFHEYFGFPPGELKKHVREDIKKTEASTRVSLSNKTAESGQKHTFLRKALFISIRVLVIAALAIFIYRISIREDRTEVAKGAITDKSIAILPFRNLSDDKANQYFADGMMEDILNHLSGIKDLKIISRTSSEIYRESDKSLPQIAEELGVSYILEGCVQKFENNAKIFVQLIDARKDQYLWSESYNKELKDIFILQSEIAKQVATELKAVLSSEEIEQIDKIPTEDLEAYNLYLKGRYFWHRRTEEGVKKSIEYFKQSLARDPKYSLAYAGLGDAYLILTLYEWLPRTEGYSKSKEYLTQALGLDDNLAEAHASLGSLRCYINWNWKFAEKELQRAIELNPNYATAYQYYSEYLDIMGMREEARVNINKALELNPNSLVMHAMSFIYYYREGKFIEALKEGEKALEIDKTYRYQYWRNFMIYVHLGDDKNAIDELQKFLLLDLPGEDYSDQLNKIFTESGIEGIIRWTINQQILKKDADDFLIAKLYSLLNEKDAAIEHLNKEIYTGVRGPRMKYCLDFEFLRDDPRFIAILNKMGLGGY